MQGYNADEPVRSQFSGSNQYLIDRCGESVFSVAPPPYRSQRSVSAAVLELEGIFCLTGGLKSLSKCLSEVKNVWEGAAGSAISSFFNLKIHF